jgi:hypothetical protein
MDFIYDSGGDETPSGIVVDKNGYIYISGTIESATGTAFLTLKMVWNVTTFFNGTSFFTGSKIWDRTYKVEGEPAESYSIAVDDGCSVYVTGRSYSEAHGDNVLTVKYDTTGAFLWQSAYDRIGGEDCGEGIVVDGKGNPYVVGRSYYRTADKSDYLILKYDTGGNIQWTGTYDSGTGDDWAYGIAIDRNDNLYVAGKNIDAVTGASRMTTIKYSRTTLPTEVLIITLSTYVSSWFPTDGIPPYTGTVIAGSLPPGIVLDNNWATLGGYPTATGNYTFTLEIKDSSVPPQVIDTRIYEFHIYETPVTVNNPGITYSGAPLNKLLTASGGVPPYRWSMDNPSGLTLDSTTGVLSGTVPSVSGYYYLGIHVVDAVGLRGDLGGPLEVYPPISITTSAVPAGNIGIPYIDRSKRGGEKDIKLLAEGGAQGNPNGWPVRQNWSIIAGSLPPGVSIDSSGIISGTPTTADTYSFIAQVVDEATGSTATKELQLTVDAFVVILDKGLNAGTANKPYSDRLFGGGYPPLTWTSSNLPDGITLSSDGVLSGMPTTVGNYHVTVQLTDSTQATATAQLELSVNNLAEEWVKPVAANGDKSKVVVDTNGIVYTLRTNYNETIGNSDLVIDKYSPAGGLIWSTTIDNGEDSVGGMALDSDNNLYVLANYYDINTGAQDHQIVKYPANYNPANPAVNPARTTQANLGVQANAFVVAPSGVMHVAAAVHNGINNDIMVYGYNNVAERQMDFIYDSGGEETPSGIVIDKNGYIYVSGTIGTETGGDFLTLKLDWNGTKIWDRTYNVGGEEAESYGIAVDDSCNVYVTGRSYTYAHHDNVLTVKYDTNGTFLWQSTYDRIGREDRAEGIVLDGNGNPYVVGNSCYRASDKSDYLIMKYDTEGNIQWTGTYDSGTGQDYAWGIAIDRNDNLYVTGKNSEASTITIIKYYLIISVP